MQHPHIYPCGVSSAYNFEIMCVIQVKEYVPRNFTHNAKPVAYVLDGAEVRALFAQVDTYRPEQSCEAFHRLALEYRVLFRVIFCCGLRVLEARKLRVTDVDLKQGILKIKQSKGDRDRLVYLSEDLRKLCTDYSKILFLSRLLSTAPLFHVSL